MRFKYNLYPDAREKLDSTGITARVRGARKSSQIQVRGHIIAHDVANMIGEMKEGHYFDTFPQDQLGDFKKQANGLFQNPDEHKWEVHRGQGVHEEPVELEDILVLMGYDASLILNPSEIWDFQRFGFRNITDFTGSVGALINETIHDDGHRKGYRWQTRTPDGRTLANEITGDMNFDMRVFQTDITPYKTVDPFGKEVSFRPELDLDRGGIIAYHSTEGELLITVLKYIHQIKLNADALDGNAKKTLAWAESLGQRGGGCAEHFGGLDQDARRFFVGWDLPLVELDKDNSTHQRSRDFIGTTGDGMYGAYLDCKNNLVFAYEPKNAIHSSQKNPVAVYSPEDATHLIKGLLFQSAKGLGRTSCKQLRSIIEYRVSGQIERDLAEMDARARR